MNGPEREIDAFKDDVCKKTSLLKFTLYGCIKVLADGRPRVLFNYIYKAEQKWRYGRQNVVA